MFYWKYLSLDAGAILHGQIWRIMTFIVYPPSFRLLLFNNLFFGITALFMYYNLRRTLESIWGASRFNVFFFAGMFGQMVVPLVCYLVFHQFTLMTTGYLNLPIFLAFAMCFLDAQFYLFSMLPVKTKRLVVAEVAVYIYGFIVRGLSSRVEIMIVLANIIFFFMMTRNVAKLNSWQMKRKKEFKKQMKIMSQGGSHHKYTVCERAEEDGANLGSRCCFKCKSNYEYCQDRLYTHQHVTGNGGRPEDNNQEEL